MRLETGALRADPARPGRGAAARLRRRRRPRTCWRAVLAEFPDEVAMVSSFGAEAAVLLNMVARHRPRPAGADDRLADAVRGDAATTSATLSRAPRADATSSTCGPDPTDLARLDPDDTLHQRDTDACCDIRKVAAARPGAAALAGDDLRPQAVPGGDPGGARGLRGATARGCGSIRWRTGARADLRAYMDAHDLPRHPLVARGYPSIGCAPCTTPVARGRGRPGRALARQRQGRVRHPFRRGRPHPARGELKETGDGGAGDRGGLRAATIGPGAGPAVRLLLERAGPAGGGAGGRVSERPRSGRARALARPAGADPRRLPGDGATGAASRSRGGCARWATPAGCGRPGR